MVGKVTSKAISDLLLRIYELPEGHDFFEHVLSTLDTCVKSDVSVHSVTDLNSRVIANKEMHRKGARAKNIPEPTELDPRVQTHPFMEYYYSKTRGPVLCTTDIMSVAEWKANDLYNEIWRPHGLLHDTSVRFYEGGICHALFFSGPVPLSKDCHRLLEFIAPHLGNAYHGFKMQRQGMLNDLSDHMILLSDEGASKDCPAGASALLGYYYPCEKKTSAWVLPNEVERWIRTEIESFSLLAGTAWGGKLIARRGRSVLSLRLMRFEGGFMLLLEESVAVRMFDVLLEKGLTPREAEVLQWVCQGKQNSEIAAILQLSTATVRKHLEHILLKLYCETRGTAAQWAMQLVNEKAMGVTPDNCLTCSKSICDYCI